MGSSSCRIGTVGLVGNAVWGGNGSIIGACISVGASIVNTDSLETQNEKNQHGASQQTAKTLSKCFDFGDKA
jgi:hypothetical protein